MNQQCEELLDAADEIVQQRRRVGSVDPESLYSLDYVHQREEKLAEFQ